MLNKLKKILAHPIFEDKDKTNAAQYTNALLNSSIIFLTLLILSGTFYSEINITLSILIIIFIALRSLMFSGNVTLSSSLFIAITWSAMTYLAWIGNGVQDASLYTYIVFIFLASLLGGKRRSINLTLASITAIWVLYYAETTSIITPKEDSLISIALAISTIIGVIALVIAITVTNLEKNILNLRKNEKSLLSRNERLIELQEDLKKHIIKIEITSIAAEERATRLETIAKVSQSIALNQNLDILLPEITRRISEDFDFYHVGIFLPSSDGKFANLRAANSTGGKRMLARKHQLEIGQVGIVGRTADDGQARIALDVGQEAIYFDNPDLPETRSEMALPLKVGEQIIGVLDVQSKRESAFRQEDTSIFETLANQTAIAIENARQAEITQAALEESRAVTRQYIQQAWTQQSKMQGQLGYRYTEKQVTPLASEEIVPENSEDILSIPVQVQKETIAFLEIRKNEDLQTLSDDKLELVQAIANRAALALDNARLLEESTRRASRERKVSEITTKIRSQNNPQAMIDTALEELKDALRVNKVELKIQKPEIN